jgi:hypothetical protein
MNQGKVASIAIVPHGGTCSFHGSVREVPLYEVEVPLQGVPEWRPPGQFGHTMELHLPDVLAATVPWKASSK